MVTKHVNRGRGGASTQSGLYGVVVVEVVVAFVQWSSS